MMKRDLKKELVCRKIKKPNRFLATAVFFFLNRISRKNKVNFHYGFDLKSLKNRPVILISTHASRLEFIYALSGFKEKNINIVCGYQNIMEKYIYGILKRLGVIAKYLYQPDFICTKNMLSVINRGGNLALFPEGIQSVSGSTHPINPTTCKFLKRASATVVLCKSEGAYLCQNRFSKDIKKGRIDFYYDLLFTPEDLATLTEEEIYRKLIEKFSYNEFKLNKVRHEKYVGKLPNSDGLDKIIYKCPCCGAEFKFKIDGSDFCCENCGYTVTVDEYYDLTLKNGNKLYYDNIDDWFKWQRYTVRDSLADFTPLEMKGSLYTLRTDKLKKAPNERILLSDGVVRLDKEFLTITGRDGKNCKFGMKEVYSLTFSLLGFLQFYHENEYYFIVPDGNLNEMIKWTLVSEEIHNLYDERWRLASIDVYG